MKSIHWLSVIVPGLVLTGLAVYLLSLGGLTTVIPRFLLVFGLMFAAYIVAVVVIFLKNPAGKWLVGYVFLIAVVCRVILLGAAPTLSTDIYRYLWEGRVIAAGQNPFGLAPSSSELEHLRDENYAQINHPHLETIYPPFAQAVFFVGAYLRANVTTQKILFTLFDIATLGVLMLLLAERGRNPLFSVVYAWSPLVLIEFAHSGHLDSAGIFFLLLSVYLWHSRKRLSSVLALTFSFLSKYLSILLLPFYLFKRRAALGVGLFVVVTAIAYLPFVDASGGLISSLRVYGDNWKFNPAVYSALGAVFGDAGWIRYGLYAVVALFSIIQGYRQNDLLRCSFLIVGCALLLTPTLYPWYLCWIIPFLCFYPSRAWLYLSGAIAASYWVWVVYNTTGRWEPGAITIMIEYIPFFVLLLWEGFGARRSNRSVDA